MRARPQFFAETSAEISKIREVFSAEASKMVVKKETLKDSLEVLWETLLSVQPCHWMGL